MQDPDTLIPGRAANRFVGISIPDATYAQVQALATWHSAEAAKAGGLSQRAPTARMSENYANIARFHNEAAATLREVAP